ncbi:MAG: ABC transporter permease [Pseudomonas sp.]|nr:MAG: ABC transporter permease [Pseudomonas sp.]
MIANISTTETAAKRQADNTPASSLDALYKSSLRVLRHLLRNPMTLAGLLVALLLVVVAAFAPWIATHDPVVQNLANALQAPGAAHWFGTDEYGRDIFSRLVYGARITLYIIALVTIIVGPIGLFIGTVSGYFGGIVDTVFMRITDIFISFPSLVLALVARAETLSLRKADFVVAVELQGASSTRIILRHIVPMCMSSVIIRLTMNMAGIILTAAALGFLGLGAQAPLPEWGAMISTGRRYMLECWWLVAVPGAAIMLVSLAFNLLGDGLRDILDPRSE